MNTDLRQLKLAVHQHCLQSIAERFDTLNAALKEYQEASGLETKSSAGDKYETGREMIQLEKAKIASQLENALNQRKALGQLQPQKEQKKVGLGSLVETDRGLFYLSVSLGMVETTKKVFCLSPASPLGKALAGAEPGSQIEFNRTVYKIIEVA